MVKMKVCSKCKDEKNIDRFGNNKTTKDGLKSRCRECDNEASKVYRADNVEKTRDYDIKRNKTATRKESHSIHAATYRKKHKKVIKAHNIVSSAIRSGKLIRPDTCSECDSTINIQAHHPDYDKPLDVVWVCPPHHKRQDQALNKY